MKLQGLGQVGMDVRAEEGLMMSFDGRIRALMQLGGTLILRHLCIFWDTGITRSMSLQTFGYTLKSFLTSMVATQN